jgi:hypothetical protein
LHPDPNPELVRYCAIRFLWSSESGKGILGP